MMKLRKGEAEDVVSKALAAHQESHLQAECELQTFADGFISLHPVTSVESTEICINLDDELAV